MYKPFSSLLRHVLCIIVYLTLVACTPSPLAYNEPDELQLRLDPLIESAWVPLYERLQSDSLNISGKTLKLEVSGLPLDDLFASLGDTPLQDPMGRKITELHNNKFGDSKKDDKPKSTKKTPRKKRRPPPLYRGVVTDANARLCLDYIKLYQAGFDAARKKTHVPTSIAVSLLFVETRLGTVLGTENAFRTLASMAATRSPQQINTYLEKLDYTEKQKPWLTNTMQKRSDWAYKELTALLNFSAQNKLNLNAMPGSMYGAIGICQFMPSNLIKYTADGNNDGSINLFDPPDAIASLSYYLEKHGWKKRMSRRQQHRVLKRYNYLNIYANTILALSDHVTRLEKRSKR